MKGKVLGFDAASGSGAITGDDGQRYTFTAADFKSPPPPKPNDAVDFEVSAGAAKNIYVTKAGGSVDLSGVASSPAMANILAKPSVIWAALVILGALVGNYLGAAQMAGAMGQMASAFNSLGAAFGQSGGFGGGGGAQLGSMLFYLLLAIPIMAGVLIFFELTNHKMTAQFRFFTAVAAIGGPILIPILALMLMGLGFHFPGIDIGFILVVGGGVLLLLTHMGIIKKLG